MPAPVVIGIWAALSAIGAWILEMAILYGKKIAFYTVVVGLFFTVLYTVSTALFATLGAASGSSYFASVSPYLTLVYSVFPSNFVQLSALIITIEFQIFFWRWAMKVLDLKVNFFGS